MLRIGGAEESVRAVVCGVPRVRERGEIGVASLVLRVVLRMVMTRWRRLDRAAISTTRQAPNAVSIDLMAPW